MLKAPAFDSSEKPNTAKIRTAMKLAELESLMVLVFPSRAIPRFPFLTIYLWAIGRIASNL
jgi:hypothetical protein